MAERKGNPDRELVRRAVADLVGRCGWDVGDAADVLDVHQSTVYRHLARLDADARAVRAEYDGLRAALLSES